MVLTQINVGVIHDMDMNVILLDSLRQQESNSVGIIAILLRRLATMYLDLILL